MGQDDLQAESRSVRLGGEFDEDDVEGHVGRKVGAAEPDGAARKTVAASDEDDVEGHVGRKVGAAEPDGAARKTVAASDEDDVEGHRIRA